MIVTINGKEFEFVRPTILFVKKVARNEFEKIGEKFAAGILNDEEYEKFEKQWKFFCSTIFKKNLLWRLGLFPKDLRLENVPIQDVLKAIKDFFGLLGETQIALLGQSPDSKNSETQIKSV